MPVFVGHLGPRELGAATLGIMLTNITGFSIVWGGMTALDTLGSQSYGAGNYPRVGVLAQRCLAMSTVACVPVAIVVRGPRPPLCAHASCARTQPAAD